MKDNSKVYKIFSLKSRKAIESDRIFWSSKTPEERLAAMEILRQQWYKIRNERPIPMNRDEELFELLNSEKVKYLIVGAYALAHYGIPRFTNDIDIFIECSKNNSIRILSVLDKFGFGDINLGSDEFQKKDRVIQLGYPPLRIDLITGIDGVTFKTAWRNRVNGKFGKQKVWYISQKDFIRNKRASGRLKDEFDLTLLE